MREGSGEDEAEAAAVGEPGGVAEGGGVVAGDSVLDPAAVGDPCGSGEDDLLAEASGEDEQEYDQD